ncbi:MAG: disulfide bond formation protein B [Gammaproteobacteria bacterium]
MYRILNLSIVGIVIASMLFALYYLEGVLFLEPCPLCMVDRAILVAIAIVCLIAFVHNANGIMRWVYTSLATLLSLIGLGVAARHIWLQGLPPDQVPECGPDLMFMLDVFPLADVIKRIFTGSGQCAEVSWTFLGMTIPQQTLLLFVVLLVLVIVAHMQSEKR